MSTLQWAHLGSAGGLRKTHDRAHHEGLNCFRTEADLEGQIDHLRACSVLASSHRRRLVVPGSLVGVVEFLLEWGLSLSQKLWLLVLEANGG